MRRLGALALAIVGQTLLAGLDPVVAVVPAFASFAAAALLVIES